MDAFVDVESLIGTAGPILLQVSTFSSFRKGAGSLDSESTRDKRPIPIYKVGSFHVINIVYMHIYIFLY